MFPRETPKRDGNAWAKATRKQAVVRTARRCPVPIASCSSLTSACVHCHLHSGRWALLRTRLACGRSSPLQRLASSCTRWCLQCRARSFAEIVLGVVHTSREEPQDRAALVVSVCRPLAPTSTGRFSQGCYHLSLKAIGGTEQKSTRFRFHVGICSEIESNG